MKKNILIFGSSGTLGRKIAEAFQEERLILCDVKKNEVEYRNYKAFLCDACNQKEIESISGYLKQEKLKIDVLIYAAGIYESGKITELSPEQWKKSMDINVTGLYCVLHNLLQYVREEGKIIAIASQFGMVGAYESAAYCASKAAMINLIRSVALDYSSNKICANCICPGFFESEFLQNVEKNISMRREWMSVLSMLPKSKVSIEDVVNVAKMLSENASITGQCITIDGGYTAR